MFRETARLHPSASTGPPVRCSTRERHWAGKNRPPSGLSACYLMTRGIVPSSPALIFVTVSSSRAFSDSGASALISP